MDNLTNPRSFNYDGYEALNSSDNGQSSWEFSQQEKFSLDYQ